MRMKLAEEEYVLSVKAAVALLKNEGKNVEEHYKIMRHYRPLDKHDRTGQRIGKAYLKCARDILKALKSDDYETINDNLNKPIYHYCVAVVKFREEQERKNV